MGLGAGVRLGSYEIVAALGVGGMGEVYRARDTRLGREIALKTLPAAFTSDPDRIARFRREAQVLAALNHPHIAAIYGLEEADGCQFLVLELADGETVARRLERAGPMAIDEAIAVARQVADALEAAHEKGIIHRDLKPANIALTEDGRVKVLDFGLAKALDPAQTPELSMSPTLTFAATQAGAILGTAAYMSPEQAKGRATDKRTDVWAYGCVLFEMLTARRAFQGEDATDTIAAVVRGEPDWALLPADTPASIRLLLKRSLEKDRRARVSDIGVARFLLSETLPESPTGPPRPSAKHARPRTLAAVAAAALVVLGGAAWLGWRLRPESAPPTSRFAIVMPAGTGLFAQGGDRDVAISPDGSTIVYRSGPIAGSSQFIERALNDVNVRPLTGHSGREPFFSPDSRWIGYWTLGEIRKTTISGGPAITIARVPASLRGVHWGPDNTIVFGTSELNKGLQSVSGAGGEPKALTTVDTAKGETGHYYPFVMPDGRSVLFTISHGNGAANSQVAVLDLKSRQYRTLLPGGAAPVYLPSGHIVFNSGGTLRAVAFDARTLKVSGDPVPVLDQVSSTPLGEANFGVSTTGTLIYVPASATAPALAPRSLLFVDRGGRETAIAAPIKSYGLARLSPDGGRAVVDVRDAPADIWVYDFARETMTPLNLDPAPDLAPLWTADGRKIVWSSTRAGGNPNLFWQAGDGSGAPVRLTTNVTAQFATSVTPDGSRLLMYSVSGASGTGATAATDIFTLALDPPDARPTVLLQSPFRKAGAEISPTGRWIAYDSDEGGRTEVYVRPFPNVDSARWQISSGGGSRPAWARNGRELFFLNGDNQLTSVAVEASKAGFSAGRPKRILNTSYVAGATGRGFELRAYDVTADAQRFLMLKEESPAPTTAAPQPSMTVILNWQEELKQRVPTR